jgi:hypothetical protein
MPDKKIQVFAYSGYRADEIPRSFVINNQKIDITDILNMWIEEQKENKSTKRFFRVRDKNGLVYTLYYNEKETAWFLRSR